MKKHMIAFFTTLVAAALSSGCKGSDNVPLQPANLTVQAVASTDGSGTVAFTATADNAAWYDFELGNGITRRISSGTLSYKYSTVGTKSYTVTVTATSSSNLSIKKTMDVLVTVDPPKLFWAEEFNVDGAPDPKVWGYDLGDGCPNVCGWGNNELEYYTDRPENVIVQGGVLKIKAMKESYKGKAYTSARIKSQDKFAFTYGKVEVKAKIPTGVGTWPAIWMLGSNIGAVGWPACGEIDIMEHVGKDLNKIYGTLHYPGRSGGNADGGTKVMDNITTGFHVFTLEWSEESIKIYADNTLIHSVTNSNSIPFNHDFFFILNVAMGGNFGGPMDESVKEAQMEVDYIRVYK
jgi:beta-glucanase (GH16 family)